MIGLTPLYRSNISKKILPMKTPDYFSICTLELEEYVILGRERINDFFSIVQYACTLPVCTFNTFELSKCSLSFSNFPS